MRDTLRAITIRHQTLGGCGVLVHEVQQRGGRATRFVSPAGSLPMASAQALTMPSKEMARLSWNIPIPQMGPPGRKKGEGEVGVV